MNQSDGGPNVLCPETNRLFCFLSFLRGQRLLLGAFLKYSVFISIYVNSCTKLHRIQIVLVCVWREMDGWMGDFFFLLLQPAFANLSSKVCLKRHGELLATSKNAFKNYFTCWVLSKMLDKTRCF